MIEHLLIKVVMKPLTAPKSLIPDHVSVIQPDQAVKVIEVERANSSERTWSDLSFAELKEACRTHGLKYTGKKSDLLARLVDHGVSP